jgi:hypothetical protein
MRNQRLEQFVSVHRTVSRSQLENRCKRLLSDLAQQALKTWQLSPAGQNLIEEL